MTSVAAAEKEDWEPTADTFAIRLVMIRHELRLTVEEAARRCGLSSATWSTWERGASPRNMADVVERIHQGLGVGRNWLMWGPKTGSSRHDPEHGGYSDQDELPFRQRLALVGV